jgi:hypothetical protein
VKILWSAAIHCWWSDPGPQVSERIVEAAEHVRADWRDPRLLAILAFAAAHDRAEVVIERLARIVGDVITDPDTGASTRDGGERGRGFRRLGGVARGVGCRPACARTARAAFASAYPTSMERRVPG